MKRIAAVLAALTFVAAAGCDRTDLIGSPGDGDIVPGDTVTVEGELPEELELGGTLTVNGVDAPIASDRTWSVDVPHADSGYVTPVEVIYVTPDGAEWRQRRAVVRGEKLDEGEVSPEGVGMRFTSTGLDGLGPVIQDLAGGAFDIGSLLMEQNPIIDQEDALLHFDITGNVYEAGIGGVAIDPATSDGGITTDITIDDLYVGLNLDIRDGLAFDERCGLELQIPTTTIGATFDLEPLAGDESRVDVNLVGDPAVDTGQVDYEFISGICDSDTFVIGDIVDSVAGPQVQTMVGEGFATNLGDPDGSGPEDSPIAAAIETALADISIAGAVGEAVQAHLDAPFTGIDESAGAIDLRADADFYATPGASPQDCPAVAGAPDLSETYHLGGSYPELGETTPGGDPYGLGLVVSGSAFNQLLGAMTECGILNQTVTEMPGGDGSTPITASLLSLLIPEFGELPGDTPISVRITPTAAPFLTGAPGPDGEPGELMLANLKIEFVEHREDVGELVWLEMVTDAPLGFSLGYDADAGALAPEITAPPSEAVSARVVGNAVGASEPDVEAVLPDLVPTFVDELGSSFASFPLPGLLGLDLEVLEIARDGNHFVLYADLAPVPETRLENVSVTDLSSEDGAVDTITDVNEWRHRLRPSVSSREVSIDYKAMLGADACCTVDDESRSAHAGYRVTMDIVPEGGESWQLDLGHAIQGSHTLIDERVALEDAGGETRFDTPVTARARVGDGEWQSFDAAADPAGVVHELDGGEGTTEQGFTGGSSTVLTGTSAATVTLEVGFDMYVKSDSNAFFPAAGGDEVAIRLGANDTITNGFTAGGYPGRGDRSIIDDGHFLTVTLSPGSS